MSTERFKNVMNYRSGAINIGNVFSHITLKKGVCDFPDVVWFFFKNVNFVLCFTNIDLCLKNIVLCLQIWATVL